MAEKKPSTLSGYGLNAPKQYVVVCIRPPLREIARFVTLAEACEHIGQQYEPSTYDVFRGVEGGIQQLAAREQRKANLMRGGAHYDNDGNEVKA